MSSEYIHAFELYRYLVDSGVEKKEASRAIRGLKRHLNNHADELNLFFQDQALQRRLTTEVNIEELSFLNFAVSLGLIHYFQNYTKNFYSNRRKHKTSLESEQISVLLFNPIFLPPYNIFLMNQP